MEKRKIFWGLIFTVVLLASLCVSFQFLNTVKSIWIGAISGSVGVLYAIMSTHIFGCKNTEKILPTASALLSTTIVYYIFKDPYALAVFVLLTALVCIFKKFKDGETFVILCTILACSIALGAQSLNLMGAFLPIVISSLGVYAMVFSTLYEPKYGPKGEITAFSFEICTKVLLLLFGSWFVIKLWFNQIMGMGFFWSLLTGILASFAFVLLSKIKWNAFKNLLKGALLCGIVILTFILGAGHQIYMAGTYAVIIAALGMVLTSTERAELSIHPQSAINILSTLGIFFAFICVTNIETVDVLNPYILISLLFGGVFALSLSQIQHLEIKNIWRNIILASLAIVIPLLMGIFTDLEATTAMFIGAIAVGIALELKEKDSIVQIRLASITFLALVVLLIGG